MEDFIKNIIVEKRYFELTPKEKALIQDWAPNEEEFDALKMTFLSVSELNIENEKQLSPKIKQSLNERFAARHAIQNEGYWNRFLIFLFPRDTQFFKKPAFQLVMVALTVALIIPFLWQNESPKYAMNNKVEEFDSIEIGSDSFKSSEKESDVQLKELDLENSDQKIEELSDEVNEPQVSSISEEKFVETSIGPIQNPSTKEMNEKFNLEEIKIDWDNGKNDEDLVVVPSAKRVNADIQQLDEIPMISSKDVAKADNKKSSKQVDASETLGLLTALF